MPMLSGELLFSRFEHVRRDFAEVANQAAPRECFQCVVGDVNFPPEEALTRAGHVMVMIVVPALAERHERQEPVVAAGVRGLVTARSEKMRELIDTKGVVPKKRGAQAETPEKKRKASDEQQCDGQRGRRNEIVFVEPA